MPELYVVYACEHLRDGREEWARVVPTIEAALELINLDRFAQGNHTFRLFELGKEIPLEKEKTEIPQPAKVTQRYVAKRKEA